MDQAAAGSTQLPSSSSAAAATAASCEVHHAPAGTTNSSQQAATTGSGRAAAAAGEEGTQGKAIPGNSVMPSPEEDQQQCEDCRKVGIICERGISQCAALLTL